jgi:hypothetical protein
LINASDKIQYEYDSKTGRLIISEKSVQEAEKDL